MKGTESRASGNDTFQLPRTGSSFFFFMSAAIIFISLEQPIWVINIEIYYTVGSQNMQGGGFFATLAKRMHRNYCNNNDHKSFES